MAVVRKIIVWCFFAAGGGIGAGWLYCMIWRDAFIREGILITCLGAFLGLAGGVGWSEYVLRKATSTNWRILVAGFIGILTNENIVWSIFLVHPWISEIPIPLLIITAIPSFIAGVVIGSIGLFILGSPAQNPS
jgi:hypothetical protein